MANETAVGSNVELVPASGFPTTSTERMPLIRASARSSGISADSPTLLIQVGSHEILLSDALRLAGRAATADVEITLEVTPRVPRVFQAFAAALDEGDAALDRAAVFLKNQLAATQPTRAAGSADRISETPMFELVESGGTFVALAHMLGITTQSAG